jgi:Zn(II)-responsive transcriptional regulator
MSSLPKSPEGKRSASASTPVLSGQIGRIGTKESDQKDSMMHNSSTTPQDDRIHPKSRTAALTIGKLAKLVQVSADSIRYYEKEGLIAPAQKSGAGYRLYTEDAVRRLNFIKHAQKCGLSLSEVAELLELKRRDDSCCNDVRALAIQKKLQIEAKINALKAMSSALNNLIETCTDDTKPLEECPILTALETTLTVKKPPLHGHKTL